MKNVKKFWLLAILFGLVSSYLAYRYLEGVKARYEPDNLVQVVKAASDIAEDTVITPEQVTVERIPAQYAHPQALRDSKEVVGKVAVSDIAAGEQILAAKVLTEQRKAEELSYSIPSGKRAVSIAVDQVSGVSGLVKPGDRVDVIGTVEASASNQNTVGTMIVLQDIEVLAVGKMLSKSKPPAEGKEPADTGTVTLAVTPEEARPLVLVSEKGSIRLALRPPADRARVTLPPYWPRNLLGQ